MIELINYWRARYGAFFAARRDGRERGASLVEYALLLALIAVVCIAAISFLGGNAKSKFSSVGSQLQ